MSHWFIFIQFAIVALYDTIQIDAEKLYWRSCGYSQEASTKTSIGMFLFWYLEVGFSLLLISTPFTVFLQYLISFAFLHYCGFEDLLYYLWEPIMKSDELSGRENPNIYYRFLWWRLPHELYWLGKEGHNSLWLRWIAGDRVEGKRFLLAVGLALFAFILVTV